LSPAGKFTSAVWFTIGRGNLSEVFYPRIDCACIRDMKLVITDGREFLSDASADCEHRVEYPVAGVPLYHVVSSCRSNRYRLEKTIFSHPTQAAVLQLVRFTPLQGTLERYHFNILLSPHIDDQGGGNTAWLDQYRRVPMLFARRARHAVAMACSAPWLKGSAGYVGVSDGWHDLAQHKQLTWAYDCAENGNTALVGEVDLRACGGVFVLALGFGLDSAEAGHSALVSLMDDPAEIRADYVRGWQEWQAKLTLPTVTRRDGAAAGRDLALISATVLRVHEASSSPGAIVASLSTPWGQVRGDEQGTQGTGGYHLVWSRDLVEAAGGLLAAGAHDEAVRALRFLRSTQMADGHWVQNSWVSGATYWDGIQLGETALPILLLDLLAREGALTPDEVARYWPMVRRAAGYLVRRGPSTQEDRWENEKGYTPFTLATVIAALLVAADLASHQGESAVATYLRETADAWNAAIESWLYAVDTELARRVGVDGYYTRSIPPELGGQCVPRTGPLVLKERRTTRTGIPIDEVVSVDALALVRFGLRAADDPRIVNTVKVIDAVLKVNTPRGPAWHRYNGDGYGEMADGSPFDARTRGVGRAWPLLTGERAYYELQAGRRDEAARLLHTMEALASESGMIPEQVWDGADIPERGLFAGRPTGSAIPLAWAHAEYLKLRRSIHDGRVFDTPHQTVRRYLKEKVTSRRVTWRFDHQQAAIGAGDLLRVEVQARALIHWTHDGWKTAREIETRDTGLGIQVADLTTKELEREDVIGFTFYWPDANHWEAKDFFVSVV
jgi:glucoamylase